MIGDSVPEAIAAFMEAPSARPLRSAPRSTARSALALVGLGFILAFRANLTNVGGEGQIAVGGIAATRWALYGRRSPTCRWDWP